MLFSVSSSTRCLVTLSCVVVGLFQPHALMGVQAADGAMAAAKAVAANTTTTTSSTTPALDCAAGTAAIYSAETLNSALDAAIDGMIALQDPLSCTTGYVSGPPFLFQTLYYAGLYSLCFFFIFSYRLWASRFFPRRYVIYNKQWG